MKEIIQGRLENIAFMQRTGMQVVEARRGYGKVVMPLAGNENHIGAMYMGALSTLAEAGAATSVSTFVDFERYFPVITRIEIDFLKPALSDVSAEYGLTEEQIDALNAELEQAGRCTYVAELPLVDDRGQVSAQAKVTVKVLSHQGPIQSAD